MSEQKTMSTRTKTIIGGAAVAVVAAGSLGVVCQRIRRLVEQRAHVVDERLCLVQLLGNVLIAGVACSPA